jgi:hypothetical protein
MRKIIVSATLLSTSCFALNVNLETCATLVCNEPSFCSDDFGFATCVTTECGDGRFDTGREACDGTASQGGGAACSDVCELLVGLDCGDGTPEGGAYCLGETQSVNFDAIEIDPVDVDDDGDQDLVLRVSASQVQIAFNDGDFTFSRRSEIVQSGGRFVKAFDINSDGRLDLVLQDDDTQSLEIFFQEAGDGLSPGLRVLAQSPFIFGDVNNDGLVDLIAKTQGSISDSALFLASPAGGFNTPVSLPAGLIASDNDLFPGDVLTDWDSDGDLDWLATRFQDTGDDLVLVSNDGTGQLSESATLVHLDPPESFTAAGKIDIADWDSDADLDIMVGRANEGVELLVNTGGVLGSRPILTEDVPINGAAGDFNGDGNLDLMLTFLDNNPDMLVSLLENDGDGVLSEVLSFRTETSLFPRAVDFNGDGLSDIYFSSLLIEQLADAVLIHEQADQFSTQFITQRADLLDSLIDINGDGFLDSLSLSNGNIAVQFGGAD